MIAGVPLGGIAFQVAFLAASGAAYYWVRRVTGRLWVAMVIHAFTDCVLYLGSGAGTPTASIPHDHSGPAEPFAATVQILLLIASSIGVISVIREDRRTARADSGRVE